MQDLKPFCENQVKKAIADPQDANQLMNSAIAVQCLGQKEVGLALQAEALTLRSDYFLPSAIQPVRLRLLMLVGPGDLSSNVPLDCLLENSDIDLIFHFLNPHAPLDTLLDGALPPHDVLMVALGENDENAPMLLALESALGNWHKPVLNRPQYIGRTNRATASELLKDATGIAMPQTYRVDRQTLEAFATDKRTPAQLYPDCDFPIIVRPVHSHGGHGLEKIDHAAQIPAYLGRVGGENFYISRFIDYSGSDGYFRKMRIALINGEAFACHMAVSSHWMVHYLNAGMYEEAWKREEEGAFMAQFSRFVAQHQAALQEIYQRTQLDYLCIDCAVMPDARLLIFEIDHAMVIHAMDLEQDFPFKQIHMQKAKDAMRNYLLELASQPEYDHACV